MGVELDDPLLEDEDAVEYEHYRALCATAVVSLLLGVISAGMLFTWVFFPAALGGMALGATAYRRVKANPDGLTGGRAAATGFILSTLFLTGGAAFHIGEYVTEVPEGYQRVHFAQLQPEAPKDELLALDGARIFIKGYVLQGLKSTGITEFTLVRDSGSCCFGGTTPKLTDMIRVKLADGLQIDKWSMRERKLGGVFHIRPDVGPDGTRTIYYLEADYLR